MKTTPQGLTVLVRPCDSGMCPALYSDDAGRVFVVTVQGGVQI